MHLLSHWNQRRRRWLLLCCCKLTTQNMIPRRKTKKHDLSENRCALCSHTNTTNPKKIWTHRRRNERFWRRRQSLDVGKDTFYVYSQPTEQPSTTTKTMRLRKKKTHRITNCSQQCERKIRRQTRWIVHICSEIKIRRQKKIKHEEREKSERTLFASLHVVCLWCRVILMNIKTT